MKRELLRLSFILLASSLIVFTACKKDKTPPDPKASFTMSNNYMKAPVDITFTNSSIDATSYLWSFSDSVTSTQASPTQTFSRKGSYDIKLTAKNDDGKTSVTSKTLTIYGNITSWSPGRIELLPAAWADEADGVNIYMSVWNATGNTHNYNGDGTFTVFSDITANTNSLVFNVSNRMILSMNSSSKATIKFQLYNGSGNVNPNIDPIVYQIVLNGSDVLPTNAQGPYQQSISKDSKVNIDLKWAD